MPPRKGAKRPLRPRGPVDRVFVDIPRPLVPPPASVSAAPVDRCYVEIPPWPPAREPSPPTISSPAIDSPSGIPAGDTAPQLPVTAASSAAASSSPATAPPPHGPLPSVLQTARAAPVSAALLPVAPAPTAPATHIPAARAVTLPLPPPASFPPHPADTLPPPPPTATRTPRRVDNDRMLRLTFKPAYSTVADTIYKCPKTEACSRCTSRGSTCHVATFRVGRHPAHLWRKQCIECAEADVPCNGSQWRYEDSDTRRRIWKDLLPRPPGPVRRPAAAVPARIAAATAGPSRSNAPVRPLPLPRRPAHRAEPAAIRAPAPAPAPMIRSQPRASSPPVLAAAAPAPTAPLPIPAHVVPAHQPPRPVKAVDYAFQVSGATRPPQDKPKPKPTAAFRPFRTPRTPSFVRSAPYPATPTRARGENAASLQSLKLALVKEKEGKQQQQQDGLDLEDELEDQLESPFEDGIEFNPHVEKWLGTVPRLLASLGGERSSSPAMPATPPMAWSDAPTELNTPEKDSGDGGSGKQLPPLPFLGDFLATRLR